MFSRRSRAEPELNALARALEARRVTGEPFVDLTLSNPTEANLPYDAAAIARALASPEVLRYEPAPFGIEPARRAVAEVVGTEPERVVLTASTSEAYGYAFKLLCDPGDSVLVPEPSYPLLEHLARFECVELAPYRLSYDGAWHVDLESLRRAVSSSARAIVVVNPNNPTGSFLKRNELAAIAELGLPLVSDEVFGSYPLRDDPERVSSALELDRNLVIALGGLSKLAGLPQLKLGWMVLGGSNHRVDEARARLELVADAYLSVSAPVQHALPALFACGRATARAIRARTRENLAALDACLAGSAVTRLDLEGGWYAVLRLPRISSEEEWVLGLFQQAGVLVQPGWFFDFADEPYAVVSLLPDTSSFAEGVRRLARFVENCAI